MASRFDVDPFLHRGRDEGSLAASWSLDEHLRVIDGGRQGLADDIFDPAPLPRPER